MSNIATSNNDPTYRASAEEVRERTEKKRAYLLHLWKVNRPYFSSQETLNIVSPRANYSNSDAKRILKEENMFW